MEIQRHGSHDYIAKERMPSGQTVEMLFSAYENQVGDITFWITLDVYHKRKQRESNVLKQTGKDGIRPLIWAKQRLIEFEEMLKKENISWLLNRNVYITVYWEDAQRRRVYERGLVPLGYTYEYGLSINDGKKVLQKQIKYKTY